MCAALFHSGANQENLVRLNSLGVTQQLNLLLWRAVLQKTLSVNPHSEIKAFCKQPSNASQVWVLWSTHVNKIRLSQPIASSVRWRTEVFKIQGFVCKRFLPSPAPFPFLAQHHFSRGQNSENPVSLFSLLPSPTETLATQASGTPDCLFLHSDSYAIITWSLNAVNRSKQ